MSTIDEVSTDGSLRMRASLRDAPVAGRRRRRHAVVIPEREEPFGLLGVYGARCSVLSSHEVLTESARARIGRDGATITPDAAELGHRVEQRAATLRRRALLRAE